MIDNKKIEEAAKQHAEGAFISGYWQACYKEGFMGCAKWMQEVFLKDLWHPANEIPKEFNHYGCAALYILQYNCQIRMVLYDKNYMSWKNVIGINECWLYVDDLLPKKGGEKRKRINTH